MVPHILSPDQVKREAREAALIYSDINSACPYPFFSQAGQLFREEFLTARANMALEKDNPGDTL